jgi:uncharacterized protein YjiS (DUF1127 family)
MALDMLYEAETSGRSVSTATRRADLFELEREARQIRAEAVADSFGPLVVGALNLVGTGLTKVAYALEGWRKRRATFGELMSLDDRLLADIGVQRADIPVIADTAATRGLDRGQNGAGALSRAL